MEFKEALKYYDDYPPQRQVVKNGRLEGEEKEPCSPLYSERMLEYVRIVRGNLFHGPKLEDEDFERNEKLMIYGLIILNEYLETLPELRKIYKGDK